jgi:hypothetical protein
MGHIPHPPPQDGSGPNELSEGDIVRIEHPEHMSEEPPEKLTGKPLEVTNIDDSSSEVTVRFDGENYTIPIQNAKLSSRTPPEIIGDIIDHFR